MEAVGIAPEGYQLQITVSQLDVETILNARAASTHCQIGSVAKFLQEQKPCYVPKVPFSAVQKVGCHLSLFSSAFRFTGERKASFMVSSQGL